MPKSCILDVDETLVHSWEKSEFLTNLKMYTNPKLYSKLHQCDHETVYSFTLSEGASIWGLYRPHLKEFLTFIDKYFDNVIIWSAGLTEYVNQIVNQIYTDFKIDRPRTIWTRQECETIGDSVYYKPLAKLADTINSGIYKPYTIDLKETLIIDDKEHTFMDNTENGILIPIYSPESKLTSILDRSDTALLKIIDWLKRPEVEKSKDYRLLDKTNIF